MIRFARRILDVTKPEPPRRPLSPSDLIVSHPDAVITVRKQHATESGGPEYVLSNESVDRHGDVILASGWDLFGQHADGGERKE
jgi:hypothetical protein